MVAEQHHQIVSRRVQQQAKRIGQEAVTAQAVGGETVLEFLDAVFAFAAPVVKVENVFGPSGAIGDRVVHAATLRVRSAFAQMRREYWRQHFPR